MRTGAGPYVALRVAARTSTFSFKGKDLDIHKIGEKLSVQAILTGSVRKAGEKLRITAELVSVRDGYRLWSEKYDRETADIFVVQDEISLEIVDALKLKLVKGEKSKILKRHTRNRDAHNFYLKGRYFWNRRNEGDLKKAIECYDEAIKADPDYSLPYLGIADHFMPNSQRRLSISRPVIISSTRCPWELNPGGVTMSGSMVKKGIPSDRMGDMRRRAAFSFFAILVFCCFIQGAQLAEGSKGSIAGKVVEKMNGRTIPGVSIQLKGTKFGTITGIGGRFEFPDIPVGLYSAEFSISGFKAIVITDIVVHPNRTTQLEVELDEEPLHLQETVDVTASYFPEKEQEPNSLFNLSAEEIRRAPGSSGDISRMLKVMPGVSNLSDFGSDLIVRGGSPAENAFYIDDIEIPNINHFPTFGSTGGFFSAINPDLLRNVDFYTGGFSAVYGDRLSSIIDMTFREGNVSDFDLLLSADLMQAGGTVEGPFAKGEGSYILSGRTCIIRNLQDLGIISFGDEYDFTFPSMSDSQARITLDLSPKTKLVLLNVYSAGDMGLGGEEYSMDLNYTQNTAGTTLRTIWSDHFLSKTSLSYSTIKQNFDFQYQFVDDDFFWNYRTRERALLLRNNNYLELSNRSKMEFGLQWKRESFEQDWQIDEFEDLLGNVYPASHKSTEGFHATKTGLFLSYIYTPFSRLSITAGLRGDYHSIIRRFHLSPRFSFIYRLGSKFSIHGGTGVFFQTLPLYVLAENAAFKELREAHAVHYILGLEYQTGTGTRVTLEVYDKEYFNLPINPDYPEWLITDRDSFTLYYPPEKLVDNGRAYSRGIELFIQKKMVKRLYGIISLSYFQCRYKDYFGIERNRIYDNRYTFNLVAGYKPGAKWEFSARWTLMGGSPYIPIDVEQSLAADTEIRDTSRINEARYPDYSTLNIRAEYRINLSKIGMILYIDVTNALNRKNVAYYYWNPDNQEIDQITQMPFFPKLGFELRF